MLTAISGNTRVCGLFGFPVEHSFSPAMHNAAFTALGLDYVYAAFPVAPDRLPAAVQAIRALNLAGVNVTVPHKEKVLPLLDQLSPGARLAGAVNTIVHRDGRLTGHNTDGTGFVRFLADEAGFQPDGRTALILGAGGAARAVAVHLALAGAAYITVANRTVARAVELAALLNEHTKTQAAFVACPDHFSSADNRCAASKISAFGEAVRDLTVDFQRAVRAADLIVQTTPLGMYPRQETCLPFPFDCLRSGQIVVDLVYNPARTLFLSWAASMGASVYNGLGMLLYQGALAFELWTGRTAPLDVMCRALPK